MQTEEHLIPYQSADLTGRRALVLAPHPDDETIGCGGILALHTRAGDPVKVVFLTNGLAGDSSRKIPRDRYVQIRKQEARAACACLGVMDLEFWGYEDRSLAGARGALRRLIDLLESFHPDIVYAPSPLEFHPDHRAACVLLCDALHSCPPDLHVAFCEIGQPIRINVLVDVTSVAGQKGRAMDAYMSQLKERPYKDITLALDRYRSLTLGRDVIYAEGFSMWESKTIRKVGPYGIPLLQSERLLPDPGESGPLVSVIVRTKDRPGLLANAIKSIASQTYANLEIVLVNDGGEDVRDMALALSGGIPLTHVAHEVCRGRSAAANSGLEAAKGLYMNFLDDDDVLYPDHIETLARRLQTGADRVAYTSVQSAYFHGPPDQPESCVRRVVHHDIDFDPERLLFQNYIPIMSVLFHRAVLDKVGEFDVGLDLFEDWDFWIRASRHYRFHHIRQVTAEYRFYGAESTEASHQRKYDYAQAQGEIFNRVVPFLSGPVWTRLLNSPFFSELGRNSKTKEPTLGETDLESAVEALNQGLKRANALIDELKERNQADQGRLREIYSSRGWVWLERFRGMKRRLLGPAVVKGKNAR